VLNQFFQKSIPNNQKRAVHVRFFLALGNRSEDLFIKENVFCLLIVMGDTETLWFNIRIRYNNESLFLIGFYSYSQGYR
jgi:hypothetical protein